VSAPDGKAGLEALKRSRLGGKEPRGDDCSWHKQRGENSLPRFAQDDISRILPLTYKLRIPP
jgi:hypothetical protein